MQSWGVPEAIASKLRAEQSVVTIEVSPDNCDAFDLFMACQTQWRAMPMGGLMGIDYSSVRSTLWLLGMRKSADLFERLRVIESAALKYFREIEAKNKPKTKTNR